MSDENFIRSLDFSFGFEDQNKNQIDFLKVLKKIIKSV